MVSNLFKKAKTCAPWRKAARKLLRKLGIGKKKQKGKKTSDPEKLGKLVAVERYTEPGNFDDFSLEEYWKEK